MEKKFSILNSEGDIMQCIINKYSEIRVKVLLQDNLGHIVFTPILNDIVMYLLGLRKLNYVIFRSKDFVKNGKPVLLRDVGIAKVCFADKSITDLSSDLINNENVSNLVSQFEKRQEIMGVAQPTVRKTRKESNVNYPSKATCEEISLIVDTIATLDITSLVPLLDENKKYGGRNMYLFLSYMKNKFSEYRNIGERSLGVKMAECDGCDKCKTPQNGVIFYSHTNKMEWPLVFKIKNEKLVDIYECQSLKSVKSRFGNLPPF